MSGLTSPTVGEIAKALVAAQATFKPAVRDATNPHFGSKFVSLTGVIDAVSASLRDAGIAFVQATDVTDNGGTVLVTTLIHESGEWLSGRYPVRAVKQDPQSEGSALTYARRYALMSLVGIAPEDDDGAAGSAPDHDAEAREHEREGLRREIQAAAVGRGLSSWADIQSDYQAWAEGRTIAAASNADLAKYRDYLKAAVA